MSNSIPVGGLKIPPFKYEVSGPSLCPGHLYRIDSRSPEQRAEFFAVTAVSAMRGVPSIGWEDAPGRVILAGEVGRINLIQEKMLTVIKAWGIDRAAINPGNLRHWWHSGDEAGLLAKLEEMRAAFDGSECWPSEGPLALVIVDQLTGEPGFSVEEYRRYTNTDGQPVAVVVGSELNPRLPSPVAIVELKVKADVKEEWLAARRGRR